MEVVVNRVVVVIVQGVVVAGCKERGQGVAGCRGDAKSWGRGHEGVAVVAVKDVRTVVVQEFVAVAVEPEVSRCRHVFGPNVVVQPVKIELFPSVITSLSISFKQVPSIAVPAFLDSVLSSTCVSPSTLFESLIKEFPFRAENTINGDKKFTYDDCNHIASLVAGAERKSDGEALIDTQHEPSFDNRFEDTIDKNLEALIGSWAHKDHHESFANSTATPTRRKICVVQSDEYGVYINEDGNAQALDMKLLE
ncbi:hypothetical protein HID58_042881 [Brassica napus]|uniref:Uncharacterized protein n=1 Tax=Brassica napus TaxID=3708 RepID=A0ABQ8BFA3_BRANA|nr:hypothetical protein HID58_042881 [Brassica napus]